MPRRGLSFGLSWMTSRSSDKLERPGRAMDNGKFEIDRFRCGSVASSPRETLPVVFGNPVHSCSPGLLFEPHDVPRGVWRTGSSHGDVFFRIDNSSGQTRCGLSICDGGWIVQLLAVSLSKRTEGLDVVHDLPQSRSLLHPDQHVPG